MEAAQRVLGGIHRISDGIMEGGADIPEWDDIKSPWNGAGIDVSHPKRLSPMGNAPAITPHFSMTANGNGRRLL